MAVFSFPVFAMTCMSSHAVTVALFGERYASSAPILALLSLGYYFNAALGLQRPDAARLRAREARREREHRGGCRQRRWSTSR